MRDITRPPQDRPREASLPRRLGWLVLIWAGSVAVLGVVGLLLRWWLS